MLESTFPGSTVAAGPIVEGGLVPTPGTTVEGGGVAPGTPGLGKGVRIGEAVAGVEVGSGTTVPGDMDGARIGEDVVATGPCVLIVGSVAPLRGD